MEDNERAQIMINTKNIDSLNCAKGIACIFVILIHCTFPSIVGEMLRAIARFAVPLFFYSHRLLPVRFIWKGN